VGIFKYCSSKDELAWYCDITKTPNVYLDSDTLAISKLYFRDFIENNCIGSVYVWNGVETPAFGEDRWANKICANGSATLYFENHQDYTLFMLKYGYR
jgi:hypothetical protein